MLDMILQILAVLGIILLVLLAVFLTIVFLVLFFPVTYRIYGKKDEDGIRCSAKVKWLFGLLRARYSYPEWGHLTVKALCFTLFDAAIPGDGMPKEERVFGETKKKAHRATKTKKEKNPTKVKNTTKVKDITKEKKVTREKNTIAAESAVEQGIRNDSKMTDAMKSDCIRADGIESDSKKEDSIESNSKSEDGIETISKKEEGIGATDLDMAGADADSVGEEAAEALDSSEENNRAKGIGKIFLKFHKIKYTIYRIYDKIKKIWKNISYYIELLKEEETKQIFQYALFRSGKIWKHVRPRHIKADILFGTGSPDTTGYLYGAYCIVSSVMGISILVTPDFEQAVFQGEVDVSGHITIWVLVWNGCKLLLDKKLRKFLKKLKV